MISEEDFAELLRDNREMRAQMRDMRALVDELVAESRARREKEQARANPLTAEEIATLIPLLAAIHRSQSFLTWTVGSLQSDAKLDTRLKAALDAVGISPVALGKLFSKAHGIPIGGFMLIEQSEKKNGHGVLRRVVAVRSIAPIAPLTVAIDTGSRFNNP